MMGPWLVWLTAAVLAVSATDSSTTTSTITTTNTTPSSSSASATSSSSPSSSCNPATLCIDGAPVCGQRWGGCYDICTPSLKPTPPRCSTTTFIISTTTPTPTSNPTSTPVSTNCSTRSICADYVNSCGMGYGGCFSVCKPYPTFTPPPCPSQNVTTTTTKTSTPVPVTTPPPSPTDCSTRTVCADYINSCGQTYGGCFSACKPWPTFTPPPCPTSSGVTTHKP